MDEKYLSKIFAHLVLKGVQFEKGLNEIEIKKVKEEYDFLFPPDLKEFLQWKLPISRGFPNWRNPDKEEIKYMFDYPISGIAFDIEKNSFWNREWGAKPDDLAKAIVIARKEISLAPKLIPIYYHRYMPSEPNLPGNPVYSVMQTDIIYYGYDIYDYLYREFGGPVPGEVVEEPREIRFWSYFV